MTRETNSGTANYEFNMYHQQPQRIEKRRSEIAPRAAQAHGLRPVGTLDSRLSTLDPRSGFTLVEMLVSVALVVIMMSMFATVFQLAAGSMGTQRGIAENDQRARSVVTVIQNDLKNRSFRVLTPFDDDEMPLNGTETEAERRVRDFAQRVGFFYISENDLNNDADDVLHFTAKLDGTTRDLYFGRAVSLYPLSTNGTAFLESNEPDRDDQNPSPDQSSDSVAAEIAIFMRGGRLYRRVLLIRDPVTNPTDSPPYDVQPNESGTSSYFDPINDGSGGGVSEQYRGIAAFNAAATGNFWHDFDFSAHFGASNYVEFHSVDDLQNDGSAGLFPLGNPRYRFGHNQLNGLPREYVGSFNVVAGSEVGNGNDAFIGRFTHEETSAGLFQYPQAPMQDGGGNDINNGNPMEQQNASSTRRLNLVNDIATDTSTFSSAAAPGIVFSGPRRAEDLLLSNVHAFDIKVWDEVMQQFLDVGHNEFIDDDGDGTFDSGDDTYGDYNVNSRLNTAYGPNGPGNRVFDTWHPSVDIDGTMGNDPPPFRPEAGTPALPKPLKAIQITIRYFDVSSNQLRQVTQQISLVD